MKQLLLVFLGGGVGSALRYLVVKYVGTWNALPIGTLAVNVLGSFLIGIVLGLSLKQQFLSGNSFLLLATGLCGGFTTFSAFSLENQHLLNSGHFLAFVLYTVSSILLGILAVYLGLYFCRFF